MINASEQERWMTWLVQASNFAKRENFSEAVARARLVQEEVTEALTRESDPKRLGRLERFLARVEQQVSDLQGQYDAWNAAIAERRQQTIDQAAEEMAQPLPIGPDER